MPVRGDVCRTGNPGDPGKLCAWRPQCQSERLCVWCRMLKRNQAEGEQEERNEDGEDQDNNRRRRWERKNERKNRRRMRMEEEQEKNRRVRQGKQK